MVKRVDGTEHESNIALRIDRAQCLPDYFARILHADVVVHDHHDLRKHGLAERPDRIHCFPSVSRIALADGHDHQILKNTFGRHSHIDDLGMLHLHDRQKHPLDHVADKIVLLRWSTDDGRAIYGIFAVGHAIDVKYRVLAFQRVEAGVVTERTFGSHLSEFDMTLEYDLGVCRNFKIDCLACHQ